MTSFTEVFGGTVIYPSDASYLALALDADTTLAWPNNTSSSPVAASIIDVTPSGPYIITLDDATLVSVGETILFNNLGPDTITVNKADGSAVLSIGPGEQWQIYLIDNTTAAGTWRTFRYGAATAQAQAAALAGAGLAADGSLLEQSSPVTEFSSTPYNATDPDRAKTLVWTGGLGTMNLPAAATVGDGWFIQVRNAGQGDLTLDPSGSETINDASTLVFQPGDSATVVCDGGEWYTIGYGQQPVFAFDYTSIAVTGGTYTLSGSELNRIAYKFTGVLVSNATIVVPATVQQYWVNNATTGAFTLSLKAAGSGTSTAVNQGETAILYCDGSAIISATTSSPFAGTLAISQGGTGATTAGGALTNLGATGIGSSVFTAATTAAGRTALAAAASGANSDITSLTGLTTPLSVAQGGTGGATASAARTNLGAAASGSNGDITALTNGAGIQIGSPTGGALGVGTLNATALYINGVGVGTGSGSVTSVNISGGTTGLTASGGPVTTSGTITLGGTLGFANGGTGQTSYTNGQLLIGNTGTGGLSKATLTPGSGINITNGAGTITIAATNTGTVTSVDASGGTTGLTFSGGPVTTSGTLTLGGTLALANGGTGASSASGARLNLGLGTLATLSSVNNSNWSGTALTVSNGGTGATSLTSGYLVKGNGASALSASVVYDDGTNVGIGTSSPSAKLDVVGGVWVRPGGASGAVADLTADAASGTNGVSLAAGFVSGGYGPIKLLTSATERVRIDSSGNVGIGTTGGDFARSWRLVARHDQNATTYIGVINGGSAAATKASFSKVTGTANSFVDWELQDNAGSPVDVYSYGSAVASVVWSFNSAERLRLLSSGAVTSSDLADAVGYKGLPQNAKTASYTLVMADQGKDIYISGTTAAQTVTIPANASVAFPVGTVIQITNDSNQNWSIAITSDTLLWSPNNTTGTRTLAAAGQATIRKVTATRWWISGVGLT